MDIEKYIDDVVSWLFANGIYDIKNQSDVKRIYEKADRIKLICKTDDEFINMLYEEKKQRIDALLEDLLVKNNSQIENIDQVHRQYAEINGTDPFGKTLLEKQSLTSEEMLEIAYCTIGSGSLHLHCGISRKIDYIDLDGKEITHFHDLLRRLKRKISEKYNITDKRELERICNKKVIRPYIIETLIKALSLTKQYPNLKVIRLDTNDKFFELVYPTLKELGFEILDEHDEFHMKELENEIHSRITSGDERFMKYKNYKFPEDLEKFYIDEPDRKNSVTVHSKDLQLSLEKIKQATESKVL